MINKKETIKTVKVLRKEVEILTSRLEPHDTGHLGFTFNLQRSDF